MMGFANTEEEAVHLTDAVPFPVEDELKRLGGHNEKAPDWNPASLTGEVLHVDGAHNGKW